MTILLDFDGTVVEHQYPKIGRCNYGCIEVIHKLQQAGHTIHLNTMRCEFGDGSLEKALNWFDNAWMFLKSRNHDFKLDPIHPTLRKQSPGYWDWEYFKANNEVFIDDQSQGVPLKRAAMTDGWMVDWDEIDRQLEANGLYKTPTNGTN